MELITAGCSEEGGFSTCQMGKCPFGDYCWLIYRERIEKENYDLSGPEFWDKI